MLFVELPHEIVVVVLQTALDEAAVPSDVLCTCRLFRDIGTDYLYTHLKFISVSQLHRFVLSEAPRLPIAPRSLVIDLTGKAPRDVFRDLRDALMKCRRLANVAEASGHDARLKHLRLQMHSYSSDSAADIVEQALQAVNPDTFTWTGPDPDHHFSIAIVSPVASCLFKQFSAWRNIRDIVVTSISFATNTNPENPPAPLMEDIPSLRTLYIGQATFLNAQAVAGLFCQGEMAQLQTVRLVDAYSESIWGPRLRRSDIEKAATLLSRADKQSSVVARIRRVVTCEKETERIMGGDRVEGTHVLI